MDARVTAPISVSLVLPPISRRKRSRYISLPSSSKPLLGMSRPRRISTKWASTALVTCSSSSATDASIDVGVLEVADIRNGCRKWQWMGQYSVNYFVSGPSTTPPLSSPRPPPLLLVHGFGASIPHWRRWSIHNHITSLRSSHHLNALCFFFVFFGWRGMYINICLSLHRNIATLSEKYTVYAIDLLGFGDSDKPAGFAYTMEAWAQARTPPSI